MPRFNSSAAGGSSSGKTMGPQGGASMGQPGNMAKGPGAILAGGSGDDVIDASASRRPVSIDGGDGNDTISGGAGPDVLTGGAGNDTLASGTGRDLVTGGSGADTFVLGLNGRAFATIADFNSGGEGDTIDLHNLTVHDLAGDVAALGAAVALTADATFADYLDAAAAGHASAATNAVIAWFQFDGDTYLLVDNNDADSFTGDATSGDQIVKLTGLIDLGAAAISASGDLLTLAP